MPIKRFIILADDLKSAKPLYVIVWLILLNSILMIACTVLGILSQYNEPGRYFREGRLMTWISTFLLIGVGYICQRVWEVLRKSEKFSWDDPDAIWKVVSFSFYFFAFDELCRVHEAIDRYFHKLFGLDPGGMSDHIDDAIVGFYGLFLFYCVFRYRHQIPLFIGSLGYFVGAFIMAAISIFFDFISGSREMLRALFGAEINLEMYMTWLGLLEEVFKIYAEIFFVGAAIYCSLRALSLRKVEL